MDIEVAIQYCLTVEKETVKEGPAKITLDDATDNRTKKRNKKAATVKGFTGKPVSLINADKGNEVVIMDKEEYDEALIKN